RSDAHRHETAVRMDTCGKSVGSGAQLKYGADQGRCFVTFNVDELSLGTVSLCTPGAIIQASLFLRRSRWEKCCSKCWRSCKHVRPKKFETSCSSSDYSVLSARRHVGFPHRIQFLLTHMQHFFTCPLLLPNDFHPH